MPPSSCCPQDQESASSAQCALWVWDTCLRATLVPQLWALPAAASQPADGLKALHPVREERLQNSSPNPG